ncbi:ribosome small subunit-dependent GTPase A [Clostridium sp. BJN0001]|uniref:ribosome small subunit-dependent GTPase A n=1 Tax=Clostridium sp. BJN0001 TaxID=2930219 RepID=UPI001FD1FCC4|nr:ribosome small subunit-dependent GTPase A [Clostridium sp. BJN0001]
MDGRIIKGIGGFYYIKSKEGIIECKARGKFRHNDIKPIVGDEVEILVQNGKGTIENIKERKNTLIRPAVSNVSQAFVVLASKNPAFSFELLNKFLVLCEYSDIKPVVCINKTDLITEAEKKEIKEKIFNIGYECFFINAKQGKGLEDILKKLKGNTTVLCGPSGVGKSTLINTLTKSSHMETGSISEKLKRGKNTTRHSELIEIEDGYIVDTPGFSTLHIKDIMDKDDLKFAFHEFDEYNDKCKFRGCRHYKEPGCAVKKAVDEKLINKFRYDFYIRILEEIIEEEKNKW